MVKKIIMMRKALGLFALAFSLWASGGFAATNAVIYTDNFENTAYTNGTPLVNGTPLINGTNYWHSSLWTDSNEATVVATVMSNVSFAAPGSTNVARIPADVILSNRFSATASTNVLLRMQSKVVLYDDDTTEVAYDTNSTILFYVNSDGYCVVRNGTNGWTTITKTISGADAVPIDTNSFATMDVYLDYNSKTWRLNVNSIQLTNNIGFINTNPASLSGFDVYSGGFATSYVDNVLIYDVAMLPVLSVSPSSMTNTTRYQVNATSQSFNVISRGDGQLNYYIITNNVSAGWSMTIATNAVGSLMNNATNTVLITYDTTSLSPGVYSNSFNVISTNWEGQTQTVQVVMSVFSMSVSPTNLANAVLRGYTATNQTFEVSADGGSMPFTASADDGGTGWLAVNPTAGYVAALETNILTNVYSTAGLSPGDYTGRVTVVSPYGGGATGVVGVSMRVYATPVLNRTPGSFSQLLDTGGSPTNDYFEVWNGSSAPVVGMGYRVMVANDAYSIIQGVSPAEGVSAGQHNTIGIFYRNLSGYQAGVYTAMVAVVATNYGSGYAGTWSATSSVAVVVAISAPDAPSQLTATKGDYVDRVGLYWRPVVSPIGGAVSYNVLRHTTFDSAYAQTIVSGLTVTNYDDMTAQPGVRYYYWVRSVNQYGQTGTNSASDNGYRRLAAPSGLFASDGEYTNKVMVGWAAVDGASAYYVYRSINGLDGVVYYTSGTDYEDNMVNEGVEYTYFVQATNAICGSVLSAGENGYVLGRPVVFSASDGQYVNKIRLIWNAVNGSTAYELWRSTQTLLPPYGGGVKIAELSGTTYDDTSVTAGVKYYYWLKAKNATALSAFSSREEGSSATAAVDLSLWGLVIQPRRIAVGGSPAVVSFRLGNNGGSALAGDNGAVRLTFYASINAVFGDGDDSVIGTVDERLELSAGSSGIFRVAGGNIVLPGPAGSYYLFMRLAPVWPSTLAPTSEGGWVTQRAGAIEVSSLGSINYQAMNDYDGDGIADIVVHGGGLWDARTVDGSELARSAEFGGAGVVVMGDYDGDHKTDPVVYDESRGDWHGLLSASGYAYVSGSFGGPGYQVVPGDYDGDGKTEPAVYDTVNSLWYALKVGGGRVMWALQFGNMGYEPVMGDYDGDGVWDLAVYNEENGLWYIRTVSGKLILAGGYWGGPGFSPVPGDYDGDGVWDFAVYDEATGRWYIVNIRGEIIAAGILWGAAGYRPVAGDFDGDGISDLAMYNENAGKWYIRTVGGTWLLLDASWGGAGRKAVGGVE